MKKHPKIKVAAAQGFFTCMHRMLEDNSCAFTTTLKYTNHRHQVHISVCLLKAYQLSVCKTIWCNLQ